MKSEMQELFGIMDFYRRYTPLTLIENLNPGDLRMMLAILELTEEGDGMAKVCDVVEKMNCPPPAVSRGLKLMEERGYLVRETNPKDRRHTFVYLTDSGKKELELAECTIQKFHAQVVQRVGREEICDLIVSLKKFFDVSKEIYENWEKEESK